MALSETRAKWIPAEFERNRGYTQRYDCAGRNGDEVSFVNHGDGWRLEARNRRYDYSRTYRFDSGAQASRFVRAARDDMGMGEPIASCMLRLLHDSTAYSSLEEDAVGRPLGAAPGTAADGVGAGAAPGHGTGDAGAGPDGGPVAKAGGPADGHGVPGVIGNRPMEPDGSLDDEGRPRFVNGLRAVYVPASGPEGFDPRMVDEAAENGEIIIYTDTDGKLLKYDL